MRCDCDGPRYSKTVGAGHVWPLRTVIAGLVLRLLCWPVLELLPLTRVLWPPVRLVSLDSYLNGSTHLANDRVTKPAALHDVSRAALNAHLAQVPQDEHLRLLQDGDAYTRVIKAAIEKTVGRGSEPSAARRTRA